MSKFITIDGLDGSGKGTQAQLLCDALRAMGKKVRMIDFPCYESESSTLVKMYLDGKLGNSPADTNAYAASMFYAADRYVSYVTDWKKDYLDEDNQTINANGTCRSKKGINPTQFSMDILAKHYWKLQQ